MDGYDPTRRLDLEIARLLGEPINTQLPVPVAISEIADTFTAEPGEHIWRIKNLDNTPDIILDVDPNGVITPVKRTPLTDVELTFKGLNSKMDYVLVEDVLNKVDTNALARRKEAISRGMDKTELKTIIDALLTPTNEVFPHNEVGGYVVTVESGDDLYDVFFKAKHGVEDYGDNYHALVGGTVKEKIDTYDKDNVTTFNYNITLMDRLAKVGISLRKIFGKVSRNASETETDLLDKKKLILVARDSTIAEGKPIQFVRRKINPAIAQLMGADVDSAQRAIMVGQVPVIVEVSGTKENVLGYSVYGYESVVIAVKNPRAIATADVTGILT
jgi:hypothetical protein